MCLEMEYIFHACIQHSSVVCYSMLVSRGVNRSQAWQLYNGDVYRHRDDINAICELMDVKRGDLELDMFSSSDLDAFIEFFMHFLTLLYLLFYLCVCTLYDIYNKIHTYIHK